MPKLWNQTIEAHRRDVRDAILDTAAALVSEHGLRQVTMSRIAEQTGIGRATLYKYFPDVDSILVAWHHRHVTAHLEHLAAVRERAADPGQRLEAVLTAWAHIAYEISRQQHGTELTALLHREQHVAHDRQQLHNLVRDVLADAAEAGSIRDDVPADDLASYCLHALDAARELPTKVAVHQVVALTMAALRPASAPLSPPVHHPKA